MASKRTCEARHRVLIVDDHPVVRDGLRAFVSAQDDLEFCGEAPTLNDALRFLEQSPVDVVVLDLSLKDCHGLTGLNELLRRSPGTRVLICSGHDEHLFAERALRAGAMGYLHKSEQSERIGEAIRQIVRGEVYLSSHIANRLLGRLGREAQAKDALACLSDRELAVFQSLGHGLTAKQIARHLSVRVKTVESYRENIKRKLGLNTSAELNRYAVQWVLEGRENSRGDSPSTAEAELADRAHGNKIPVHEQALSEIPQKQRAD